jgi:hypothetical protein
VTIVLVVDDHLHLIRLTLSGLLFLARTPEEVEREPFVYLRYSELLD